MFDFSNVEEVKVGGGNANWMTAGINRYFIVDVSAGKSPQGTDFLEFTLLKSGVEDVDGNRGKQRIYFSQDSAKAHFGLRTLKGLANKLITNEEFEALGKASENFDKLAFNLTKAFHNKEVRLKILGREYMSKKGTKQVGTQNTFAMAKFAEACTPGAEYPAVADEATELTYDPTNKYDMEFLKETATETSSAAANAPAENDLPF